MIYKLEDVLKAKTQGVNTTTDKINYVDNGYKIVQAKNIEEYSITFDDKNYIDEETYSRVKEIHKLHEGEVLFTNIGSQLGNSAIYSGREKAIITWNVMKLIPNEKLISNKYLCYILNYNKPKIRSLNSSSTMPFVSGKVLMNFEIDIPSVEIQNKVTGILDSIQNKIKLNNQINDNLLKICNCIFHNYLDENETNVVYKRIVDIADYVITGKTPSTKNKELWKDEIPFITIPDMHNQVFIIETERKISRTGAKSLIPKYSISVSCIATVGLVSINTEESQTNQQINSIVLKNEYDLYYLYEYLSEQEGFLKNIAGGSTTYNINKNMFENIEIPYLPIDRMKEFNNTVCQMFESIKEKQLENKRLSIMRDTLLPKLMSGEIDLDKVQI